MPDEANTNLPKNTDEKTMRQAATRADVPVNRTGEGTGSKPTSDNIKTGSNAPKG